MTDRPPCASPGTTRRNVWFSIGLPSRKIGHDHLLAGKARIDLADRQRHAVTVLAARQDGVLQGRALVIAAVHGRRAA